MARRTPRIESLEARAFLAGNVAVSLSDGLLTLTGDSQSNVIQLIRDGDTVRIVPDATTQISRGTAGAAVDVLGVTGAIRVRMGGGNDAVTITAQTLDGGTVPFAVAGGEGKLTIDLGAGNDTLTLAGVRAGDVSIATGAGANRVTITAFAPEAGDNAATDLAGKLTVTGGGGGETVAIAGLQTGGDVTLALRGGSNSAVVTPFDGGGDNFDVAIGGSFSYDSSLARGVNTVLFDDPADAGSIAIDGSLRITLGLMSDTVRATSAAELTIGGSVFISGCLGDDTIALSNVDVGGLLIVYGSAGNNHITLTDVTAGIARWVDGQLTITGFSLDALSQLKDLAVPRTVSRSLLPGLLPVIPYFWS